MALVINPISPRTPSGLFAALALSPSMATGQQTPVPSFHFCPATASQPVSPFFASSIGSPTSAAPEAVRATGVRPLALNEARQLTLLLTQHLLPVQKSQKGLMSESIALAEKLHDVGIRWDSKRRVMGTHLRGIWEEGQRLGNAKAIGGFGPMDLYVQGSFLTIAEEPHPLDPMPIALEVHPASFAALPKLTLQAGLANSLPGVPTMFENTLPAHAGAVGPEAMTPFTPFSAGSGIMELDDLVADAPSVGYHAVSKEVTKKKRSWRDRKNAGLKIKTDGHLKQRLKTAQATPLTSRRVAKQRFKFGKLLRRKARKVVDWKTLGLRRASWQDGPVSAAMSARRVSFGGWEVR